jgi:hypothetical protein
MSFLELPTQLFSFLGEYLELKEIRALALTNKQINQKIEKEKIYYHYLKKRFGIITLPEEFKSWKEFTKKLISVEWGKCSPTLKMSEDKLKVESSGAWGCALTNLSFTKGRHLITFLVERYSAGFLGIAFENTPLGTYCGGNRCFAYSPYYKGYR